MMSYPYVGDSRSAVTEPPEKFMRKIGKWLKARFRGFAFQGDIMEHGDQKDITECSIATRNTIARATFNETLWMSKERARERINCFIHLAKNHTTRNIVSHHSKRCVTANWPTYQSFQHVDWSSAKKGPLKTLELTDPGTEEISVAIALGDFNFPNINDLILAPVPPLFEPRRSRLGLDDLLNPEQPETIVSSVDSQPQVGSRTSLDSSSSITVDPSVAGNISSMSLDSPTIVHPDSTAPQNSSTDVLSIGADTVDLEPDDQVDVELESEDAPMQVDKSTNASAKEKPKQKSLFAFFKPKTAPTHEATELRKRGRGDVEGPSDTDTDACTKKEKRTRTMMDKGQSASAIAARDTRASVKDGTLNMDNVNKSKYKLWQTKLRGTDSQVEFHPTNIRLARHSPCGNFINVQTLYTTSHWKLHLEKQCPADSESG